MRYAKILVTDCPKCGADEENIALISEDYDSDGFMLEYKCKKCGTRYYDIYDVEFRKAEIIEEG